MSLRPSNSLPSTCSGDMYRNVPIIVPSAVIGVALCRGGAGSCAPDILSGKLGQTEIQKLRAHCGEHDVAWLQVAVSDAAAMRPVQRVRNLRAVFQYLFYRQRPSLKALGERLPFDTFHYQEVDSVLMTNIMQHTNVGMIQARDRFCFAFEALPANRIRRELSGENLDGNIAVKARVACTVNFAHAALA